MHPLRLVATRLSWKTGYVPFTGGACRMIPPEFEYAAPHTLPEALSLLQQNPEAKILSGGQSLIPVLKLRLANPPLLIDINRIAGLDTLKEEGGWLRIG